jgi:hypothetical protein
MLRSLVVALRKESYLWKNYFATVLMVFVLDTVLLINWSGVEAQTFGLVLLSCQFFALYSLIGCLVGSLPVLAGQWLFKKLTA